MKILSLGNCELSPLLGSGKTRLAWSTGLRVRGHVVDLLEPRDIEFLPRLKKGKRFRLAWGARQAVTRRLRENDYDLVEFFGGEFGWITRHLAGMKHRPLTVAHTDGIELLAYYSGALSEQRMIPLWNPSQLVRRLHHRLDDAAFRYADCFVTGSQEDREFVLRTGLFDPQHSRTISPGIDAEYLGRPFETERTNHIAYAGTWTERKNLPALVSVTTAVLTERPGVLFNVFGASGAAAEIATAFSLSVSDRVIVHPRLPTEELARRLGRCAVFFFPSLYEGFGLALAEAMGCGCAAVTTPTGFGAELENGQEALVCARHDVAAMKGSVLRLLDDTSLRGNVAKAGWQRVQALNWKNQVASLEQTYLGWLAENRP